MKEPHGDKWLKIQSDGLSITIPFVRVAGDAPPSCMNDSLPMHPVHHHLYIVFFVQHIHVCMIGEAHAVCVSWVCE